MPDYLLRDELDLSRADLTAPQQIAQHYKVSILASAIRYTELAREPCAAVLSVATKAGPGKVKWAVPSATFDYQIVRGKRCRPHRSRRASSRPAISRTSRSKFHRRRGSRPTRMDR